MVMAGGCSTSASSHGDNSTFLKPVFVVTHNAHGPIVKNGGTTYFFITDGIESALKKARAVATAKDISVEGARVRLSSLRMSPLISDGSRPRA